MSTELVSIKERIKSELKSINKTVPQVGAKIIGTKDKIFALPDGTSGRGPLSMIVVGWRNFNQFFPNSYNEKNPEGSKCFAISSIKDEMKPHSSAPEPQAETCELCPYNQWGSSPNGKGKACKNQMRVAVITADPAGLQEPMLIKISPTGLKSFAMYASMLAANDVHPMQMVTEISFDPNKSYPTLLFKAVEPHNRDIETFGEIITQANLVLDSPPISGD